MSKKGVPGVRQEILVGFVPSLWLLTSGVNPSLSWMLGEARPFWIIFFTIPSCPLETARWRGVEPDRSRISTLIAGWESKRSTTSSCPLLHAEQDSRKEKKDKQEPHEKHRQPWTGDKAKEDKHANRQNKRDSNQAWGAEESKQTSNETDGRGKKWGGSKKERGWPSSQTIMQRNLPPCSLHIWRASSI